MHDWDDFRIALAVAEDKSVTAAARRLGVNHATISRRLSALEARLGARLFDRSNAGYVPTEAGSRIFEAAAVAATALREASGHALARDTNLAGTLRFTAPAHMLHTVILPGMRPFFQAYPQIRIQFIGSDTAVSIHNHDADIALRVTTRPPEGLTGRRLTGRAVAIYASAEHVTEIVQGGGAGRPRWIGLGAGTKAPDWVERHYPAADPALWVDSNTDLHLAVRAGLGIAQLPCRVGDADPGLVRVPPFEPVRKGEVWLLYNSQMRRTARLRVFSAFISDLIVGERDLFEGRLEGAKAKLTE